MITPRSEKPKCFPHLPRIYLGIPMLGIAKYNLPCVSVSYSNDHYSRSTYALAVIPLQMTSGSTVAGTHRMRGRIRPPIETSVTPLLAGDPFALYGLLYQ